MPSISFNRFKASYFGDGYDAWHDGLDESALLDLEGEERDEAERMLLAAQSSDDYRPIAGLATLNSTKGVAWAKSHLTELTGRHLVEAASLLWKAEELPAALKLLVEYVNSNDSSGSRIDAVRALASISRPESVAALESALNDPD